MTSTARTLCAEVAAQARPDERVEVFARRTRTAMTRLSGDGERHEQLADGWLIGVRSVLAGQYGLATTNVLSPASLRQALTVAREIRGHAPRPWPCGLPPGTAGDECAEPEDTAADRADLAPLRELAQQVSQTSGVGPARITAGSTYRNVARCASTGESAAYTQQEAQLHIRSSDPGLDAVQGVRLRPSAAELPVADTIRDYQRCQRHLAGAPAALPEQLDWVALSPLVVARMVSRLSRGFLRSAPRPVTIGTGVTAMPRSSVVTLIDDGRPAGGPAGSPFDDEGTPRRRNVLLREGAAQLLLGSRETGPTTGNAFWAGWSSDITVATTNCFLEPTCQDAEAGPLNQPGTGFVAEDLRGFRSGLDLTSSNIEFELGGALISDGELRGSALLAVSATAEQFLGKFLQVYPAVEFYRITGIYGGSWCLMDGSVAR